MGQMLHPLHAVVSRPDVRALIEARIETLVDLLNAVDGECDLEPWFSGSVLPRTLLDGEEEADEEPSLGSTDGVSQLEWGSSPFHLWQVDLEDQHDDIEPEDEHGGDVQDEPHDEVDEDTGIADLDSAFHASDEAAFAALFQHSPPGRRTELRALASMARSLKRAGRRERDVDEARRFGPGCVLWNPRHTGSRISS